MQQIINKGESITNLGSFRREKLMKRRMLFKNMMRCKLRIVRSFQAICHAPFIFDKLDELGCGHPQHGDCCKSCNTLLVEGHYKKFD